MSKINGKFEIGGHTLTFNVNTLCDLEDAFGVDDVNEVLAKIEALQTRPSLKTIRTIFAVAMRQDDPGATDKDAGTLISEVGIEAAAEGLGEAIAQAFPATDVEEEVGNAPKSKKAA